MYKSISFFAAFNERTGYGIHASRFVEALEKLLPVYRNQSGGEVSVSLIDSVSIQNVNSRLPYPSILFNVWESSSQPQWFMERLKYFDQLWVASEAQRSWSIADGIPEEFVKVIPEGVDPDTFFPVHIVDPPIPETFNFFHVGQFQPRKSTREICAAFIFAFPDNPNVRLYLSADTLFPSDDYKSTKERLKAYGIDDPRIIPIHFENRDDYVRRLQQSHVFVSCSRSEGFYLPGIESMACGIPAIFSDYGGTTEYADSNTTDLLVRVPRLRKPEGIYGNWDVPGKWGEPDYNHLVEVMQDAYRNYAAHKQKALRTSDFIRTEFSWEKAAQKAYDLIQQIPERPISSEVKTSAENAIFIVDCWPSTQAKLETLAETISQIHSLGYPVLVTSHYPLPQQIIQMADFYLYEKRDILSGDDKPIYWRQKADGTTETKPCTLEYQGVAALNCARNAIDFCRGRYDWLYQMSADMEVDLEDWLAKVHASDKPLVFMAYEGVKNGFGGGLWAATSEMADKVFPCLNSWAEYASMFPDVRFVAERWLYNYIATKVDIDSTVHWIECETRNRFDNVDRTVWAEDEFQCHFVDGPWFNIAGISDKQYDVEFSNPEDGVLYSLKQKCGMFSRPNKKYYRDWTITASLDGDQKFHHHLNLASKRVLMSSGSKALGDTIAWVPYVEEFRKKHNCHVIFSSWWNKILDYPELELVIPGSQVENIYASYEVGCFDTQPDKNPVDWRTVPLQKVAADILGLDYEPLRPRLKYTPYRPSGNGHLPKPYCCFSEFSTMQNKMWNREGAWQVVIDYVNSLGYDCVSISSENSKLLNIVNHCGQSIEATLTDLSGASFYLGLNHGPLWLAYALDVSTVLLTGVSEPFNDPPVFARVQTEECRPGCFNSPDIPIGRSWEWCPRNKNFACTRDITETMVIEQVNRLLGINQIQAPQYTREARL